MSTSTSTIHDIGYRHYDGPRLGAGYLVRSLYVHNLRAAWGLGRPARAKIMPFLLAAAVVAPAAMDVGAALITKRSELLWPYAGYAFNVQVILAIFVASQAPVLASRELRFHVVPLYFSRPIAPLPFVLAKFAAMATAVLAMTGVPVLVLYVGGLIAKMPHPGTELLHFLAALVGCVLYALVLAAIGTGVAALTPRRGFGVTAVIAVFLLTSAIVTLVQNIAEAQTNFAAAKAMGFFAPFNLVDIVQVRLLGAEPTASDVPSGVGGGLLALVLCALVVAGGLLVLHRRFRKAGLS
ncbi:ABC transporter permease [Actinomadura atramentaria]|uniref:ABC transporter permease n=1 Tax=Actinomadura atramentaria TaxID=1990 RepID=UPI0003668205|nr:ABC transporter permease [Actinomadura atramentaria]